MVDRARSDAWREFRKRLIATSSVLANTNPSKRACVERLIDNDEEDMRKHPNDYCCPLCQAVMHRRKGVEGHFWGCSGFLDGCRFRVADVGGMPDCDGALANSAEVRLSMSKRCQDS